MPIYFVIRIHWQQPYPKNSVLRPREMGTYPGTYPLRQPRIRAGRKRTARTRAKTAPTVTHTIRNGKETTQINGSSTSATTARGQLSARRMHHATNRMSAFIGDLLLHDSAARQVKGDHPGTDVRSPSPFAILPARAPVRLWSGPSFGCRTSAIQSCGFWLRVPCSARVADW
jgi:hypothetical protein